MPTLFIATDFDGVINWAHYRAFFHYMSDVEKIRCSYGRFLETQSWTESVEGKGDKTELAPLYHKFLQSSIAPPPQFIPGAAETYRAWQRVGHKVHLFTARHEAMREGTVAQIEQIVNPFDDYHFDCHGAKWQQILWISETYYGDHCELVFIDDSVSEALELKERCPKAMVIVYPAPENLRQPRNPDLMYPFRDDLRPEGMNPESWQQVYLQAWAEIRQMVVPVATLS